MPPNVNRLIGKQAYKDYFTSFFEFFASLKSKEMEFNPTEFVVSDGWAFQIGTYTTKFVMPDDSELKDVGNYVWIFKKESDGKWKWARVISNSTLPVNS